MACPSQQRLLRRVGRGNGERSYEAADRQASVSETQGDTRPNRAMPSRDTPDLTLHFFSLLFSPLTSFANLKGKVIYAVFLSFMN